jgi:hypothetical protein
MSKKVDILTPDSKGKVYSCNFFEAVADMKQTYLERFAYGLSLHPRLTSYVEN